MEVGYGAGESKKEAEQRACYSVSQGFSDNDCTKLMDKLDALDNSRREKSVKPEKVEKTEKAEKPEKSEGAPVKRVRKPRQSAVRNEESA